jgi:hypothetical protein
MLIEDSDLFIPVTVSNLLSRQHLIQRLRSIYCFARETDMTQSLPNMHNVQSAFSGALQSFKDCC